MSTKTDKIICPTCKQSGTWNQDNPFRPFCSDRCKLIDLGEWAAEEHRIPGEPANPESSNTNKENEEEE